MIKHTVLKHTSCVAQWSIITSSGPVRPCPHDGPIKNLRLILLLTRQQGRRRRSGRSGHGRTTFAAAHANLNLPCEQSIPKLWLSWFPLQMAQVIDSQLRVKTYFRSAMTQTRLNSIMSLHVLRREHRRSRSERNRKRVHGYRNERHRCVLNGKF